MASQAARDLCWVVNSPSLIRGANVASAAPIDVHDIDEAHLEHFLATRTTGSSVGRYFEHLLHFWLSHVRNVDVVATGMQLKEGNVTVGELDFLYRDDAAQLVHNEASVKFYLHAPGTEPSEYLGPNARDNFEHKIAKLFDQQLSASVGRVDGIDRREGFVRGMIFYHTQQSSATPPERLDPDHGRGFWNYVHELDDLNSPGKVYLIVQRPHWLAPVEPTLVLSFGELEDQMDAHFNAPLNSGRSKTADFGRGGHPLMVSIRDEAAPHLETERGFIVDHDWPAS